MARSVLRNKVLNQFCFNHMLIIIEIANLTIERALFVAIGHSSRLSICELPQFDKLLLVGEHALSGSSVVLCVWYLWYCIRKLGLSLSLFFLGHAYV